MFCPPKPIWLRFFLPVGTSLLGHHIDTRDAFNDRLLFPDEATFERIHMSHSDADNELAAKKALDLLNHSVYANQLSQPACFSPSWMHVRSSSQRSIRRGGRFAPALPPGRRG